MYLDNAATSYPKPEKVYEAVIHAMRDVGASPGRGGYRRSLEAGRILYQAREATASLFSIADSSRIIFTQNATEALNLALYGTLIAGDHVITTSMEHNSLLRPLYALRNKGVELSIVPAASDGVVAVEDIRRAMQVNTRMIAVSHVSNVCGAIQPIKPLAELCRETGALFMLDAAQSAGYLPIDVELEAIDLLAVPGHKGLLGPTGTGLLYAAPHVPLKPVTQGGTGSHSTAEEQPEVMPDGFEAGTHNMPGIAGLCAGIEFIHERGISALYQHESSLLYQAEQALINIPGITIYGPSDPSARCSVLSFTAAGVDSSLLAAELDHGFDIAVRAGLHCAPLAHRTLGTLPGGTVRLSPGWSTTSEEIAFFSDAVVQCISKIRKSA
ncbi:MAG: aminotransferase class V-fold PLP-dependent enzyme [Desulfuromonadaceae bacterium]|nr:aminotransferase class V-fold PLP-dependent enzyme [Desulfuromonadaceae bacterium]MDD2847896.1 aminotransferase class V-fold PLP-dependent enzyme [Desulfuromonadaceae bacterium]MDD4129559.1 aminotransferase class V-fold PLP-dependent enzyme [Desulfuromonadaceae bacterium]